MRFWTPPEPPFCHGNRQSVRYHNEGYGGDFYIIGPRDGVYAADDFGATVGEVCPRCEFVFRMAQRSMGMFTLKECKVYAIPRALTVRLREEYKEEQRQKELEWIRNRKPNDFPKLYTLR